MTIREAVERYTKLTRDIEEVNKVVNVLWRIQNTSDVAVVENMGLDVTKTRAYLLAYMRHLKQELEKEFGEKFEGEDEEQ